MQIIGKHVGKQQEFQKDLLEKKIVCMLWIDFAEVFTA